MKDRLTEYFCGKKVRHTFFGHGYILDVKLHGTLFLIQFTSFLNPFWVKKDELQFIDFELPKEKALKQPMFTFSLNGAEKRSLLESLRLGIVPEKFITEFTFGRKQETERIVTQIEQSRSHNKGTVIIIEDEYGKGKTHLLDYLKVHFLKNKYAVSSVSFDPLEVTPYRIKRVYQEIIRTFRYIKNNELLNFTDFIYNEPISFKREHIYLSPFLRKLKKGKEGIYQYLDWIYGEYQTKRDFKKNLPAFLNDYIAANVYCYILTGISVLIRNIGLSGWIILFDEAESLWGITYSSWREKGENFLKGLIYTVLDKTNEDKHITLSKLQKGGQELYYNPKTGLFYSGRRKKPLPYRFSDGGGEGDPLLFLLFAFTPTNESIYTEIIEDLNLSHRIIHLDELSYEEYEEMFLKIVQLYQEAYAITFDKQVIPILFDHFSRVLFTPNFRIRFFIKGVIEALDLLRYGHTPRKICAHYQSG